MTNSHRQPALQLAGNQFRHNQVAALHDRMVIQQFYLAGGDIHRHFRQGSDGTVIGHRRVIALSRGIIDLITWQRFELATGVAHSQAINRQAFAIAAQGKVRFRPLPAVENVHRCACDPAHLVKLFCQPLQAQHLHTGSGQSPLHPTRILSAHH
ncbi:hypothetical protein D3C78_1270090 [compost metagenome]